MATEDQTKNGLHRLTRKIFSVRPVAWLLSRLAHRADKLLLNITKGRYSVANLLAGVPVISLTTTGARSGASRTVPLLGIPDGENIILVASNWGQGHHPAWYYNIRVNPGVTVGLDGQVSDYVARETEGEERSRCWQKAVQVYPGYASYEKWTGGRKIPVIQLVPESG